MSVYVRTDPLWHVSGQQVSQGARVGPHKPSSPHWQRVQADPKQKHTEDAFETHRPAAAVSRSVALFATDDAALIRSLLRQRTSAHLYRVVVPDGAGYAGRFDMRLVRTHDEDEALVDAATAYWAHTPNPSVAPRWEVLATELEVVRLADPAFVAAIRKLQSWQDLTYTQLEQEKL